MPYDYDNVLGMITNPRFYIIGLFDKNNLVGVSSLDYKCGKLIGKIDFGTECNTDSMVELAFNMVSSQYRGNGLMSEMIKYLIENLNPMTMNGVCQKFTKTISQVIIVF